MLHGELDSNLRALRFLWIQLVTLNIQTIFGIVWLVGTVFLTIDLISSYNWKQTVISWNDAEVVYGIITSVDDTRYSKEEEESKRIFKYSYHYTKDNVNLSGVAYGKGLLYEAGDTVKVMITLENEKISTVWGLHNSPYRLIRLLLTSLLPLIGIILIIRGMKWGIAKYKIVLNGKYTKVIKSIIKGEDTEGNKEYENIVEYFDVEGNKHKDKYISKIEIEKESEIEMIFNKDFPNRTLIIDDADFLFKSRLRNYYRQ